MLRTKPTFASVLHCKFAGLVFYGPWIPHSATRWRLTKPMMDLVKGCSLGVYTEDPMQEQTVFSVDREHRNGCASWVQPRNGGHVWVLLTMNGSWQQWAKQGQWARAKARATSNAKFREDWLVALLSEQLLEPNVARGWQRENGRFFRTMWWWYTSHGDRFDTLEWSKMQLTRLGRFELYRQESGGRRAFSVSLLNGTSAFGSANVALKGAICTRGGVLKFIHVVNNDTTNARCTYLHSCLQYTFVIKCSVCSYPHWMRTLREWLEK